MSLFAEHQTRTQTRTWNLNLTDTDANTDEGGGEAESGDSEITSILGSVYLRQTLPALI
jgi:hypothetical protein